MTISHTIYCHRLQKGIDLPPKFLILQIINRKHPIKFWITFYCSIDPVFVITKSQNHLRLIPTNLSKGCDKQLHPSLCCLNILLIPASLKTSSPLIIATQGGHIGKVPDHHYYVRALVGNILSASREMIQRDSRLNLRIRYDKMLPCFQFINSFFCSDACPCTALAAINSLKPI